ncbi:chromate resistance protein ChrB domain-containing protein [Piscinibacter sp.]|uniref:chromate resistance protein ChrB domain-containing protein n=1 Tax=Piscinibacter sp. TaxID=1903157 RepID=UPI002BDE3631|nr:chromate resistance protein ChrB domain-containing protein [Albitalea sp.]HUG24736.1 chromate resistance protein ChrB domain-containing protein [Albitalea sp.]
MLSNDQWMLLIASLPTAQTAARMRLWRALKATGAATLRDGVYLMPDGALAADVLSALADEVRQAGGDAWLLSAVPADPQESAGWRQLFDRSADYAELISEVRDADPSTWPASQTTRRMQALWRRHAQIVQTDHFPGESQRQSQAALETLQTALLRLTSPDEPHPSEAALERLPVADYVGRTWATRRRPWVDRLASAWLIRRCIDPQATFRWIETPEQCQAGWLGFDFDGAHFSHTGPRVTYETLLASFGLEGDAALERIGALVHFLDVGGVPVAQAPGIEAALAGLREHLTDDDRLLDAACAVFDGLRRALTPSESTA